MQPTINFLAKLLLIQCLLVEETLQKVVVEVASGSQYPADITAIDFQSGIGLLKIRDVFSDIEDMKSNRFNFSVHKTIRIGVLSGDWSPPQKDCVIQEWLKFTVETLEFIQGKNSLMTKGKPVVIITFNLGNKVMLTGPNKVETTVYVFARDHDHEVTFVPPGTKNGEYRHPVTSEVFINVTPQNTVLIKSSSVLRSVLMMAVFDSPNSTVEQMLHSDTVKASEITSVLSLQFETKELLCQCEDFHGVKVDDYFYARFLRETKFSLDIAKKMLTDYIDFRNSEKHYVDKWSTYKSPDEFNVLFIRRILNENKQPVFIIKFENLDFNDYFKKGDNQIEKLITFGHFMLHQLECISEKKRRKIKVIKISIILDFKNVNWPKTLNTNDTNCLKEALSSVSKYYPQLFDVAIAVNPCIGSDYVMKALGACTTHILTNTTDRVDAYINSNSLPVEYVRKETQLADNSPVNFNSNSQNNTSQQATMGSGSQDIATSTAEIGLQKSNQKTSGDSTPPIGDSTPPIGDSTPPIRDSTPPIGDSTPPIGDSTPPIGGSTPPIGDLTPPIGDLTPPIDDSTPPIGDSTPPIGDSIFHNVDF